MSDPKVSYVLMCYEQEEFVRDAVRSALAQDLAPLDIVLSDDGSGDRTFEILEEEAKAYRGPNSVTLNRNPDNLGIEHYNKATQLAKGDLVVVAHGDDIALPHRARRLAEVWTQQRVSVISSNAWMIDAESKQIGLLSADAEDHRFTAEEIVQKGWRKTMLGASLAFDREVFTEFGWFDRLAIPAGTDHVLPFRGAILRGMYYVAEPLLRWRQHAKNLGDTLGDKTGAELAMRETYAAYSLATRIWMLDDVRRFRQRSPDQDRLAAIQRMVSKQIDERIRAWIRLRNLLYLDGKRPTWIDRDELVARSIRDDFRVWPDKPASES